MNYISQDNFQNVVNRYHVLNDKFTQKIQKLEEIAYKASLPLIILSGIGQSIQGYAYYKYQKCLQSFATLPVEIYSDLSRNLHAAECLAKTQLSPLANILANYTGDIYLTILSGRFLGPIITAIGSGLLYSAELMSQIPSELGRDYYDIPSLTIGTAVGILAGFHKIRQNRIHKIKSKSTANVAPKKKKEKKKKKKRNTKKKKKKRK